MSEKFVKVKQMSLAAKTALLEALAILFLAMLLSDAMHGGSAAKQLVDGTKKVTRYVIQEKP